MKAVRSSARALSDALRLLSVVPMPPVRKGARGVHPGTTAVFPLVGLLFGLVLAGCALAPISSVPRAALLVAVWTALPGGLHEDGWADAADAALAPVSPGERARILDDPRVGAHGLTATVLVLLLRFGALTVVPPAAVLAVPVVGRWAMAVSLATARPLSSSGLGALYGRRASAAWSSAAAVPILAAVAVLTDTAAPLAVASVGGAAAAWASCRFLTARIGGLNGDGHGALGMAAETAALWAWLLVLEASG